MKSSLHAKRMARNHRRHTGGSKLNLVSLMDIFTILVFFLMVNSGDVEVLSVDKNISLPMSLAEKKPALSLTIKVIGSDIIVQDRVIGSLNSAGVFSEESIKALNIELQYQSSRQALTEKEKISGRSIIIMGDKKMPFTTLKQLMTTCSANDYRDISLAVSQIVPSSESESESVES